jgi:exocyst complex component 4
MALINSLCATLRMTPFHQESYSRMILGVIIQFYQRCSDRFQDLVSLKQTDRPDDEHGSEPRLALAALWSQKTELSPILSNLLDVDVSWTS